MSTCAPASSTRPTSCGCGPRAHTSAGPRRSPGAASGRSTQRGSPCARALARARLRASSHAQRHWSRPSQRQGPDAGRNHQQVAGCCFARGRAVLQSQLKTAAMNRGCFVKLRVAVSAGVRGGDFALRGAWWSERWCVLGGPVGPSRGPSQAPGGRCIWCLWSFSRLWVAATNRHSDLAAALPRRLEPIDPAVEFDLAEHRLDHRLAFSIKRGPSSVASSARIQAYARHSTPVAGRGAWMRRAGSAPGCRRQASWSICSLCQ